MYNINFSYVPISVKNDVWYIVFGTSINGNCLACLQLIQLNNYHCGFYISTNKGGKVEPTNIVPLCIKCYQFLNNRGVSEITPHINIINYLTIKNNTNKSEPMIID